MLLEVILALALFAAAAAIVGGAMSSCVEGVERQKRNTHAVNLAASVVAEIQMGLRTVESPGPAPFEAPFDQWTWELALTPADDELGEASGLTHLEVTVRHPESAHVFRLAQVLKLEKTKTAPGPTAALSY